MALPTEWVTSRAYGSMRLNSAFRRGQQIAVLIADMSLGNVGVPVAVLLGLHGMLAAVPIVERSDDGYSLGTRRPHAETNSPR